MFGQPSALAQFVYNHTIRGECKCGQCIDKGTRPDPVGHTADLELFKVATTGLPEKSEFIKLSLAHDSEYPINNVFDGKEHSFIELGAWLGDQTLALRYMGLGHLLGVFELLTPSKLLPDLPPKLKIRMASDGLVTILAKNDNIIK